MATTVQDACQDRDSGRSRQAGEGRQEIRSQEGPRGWLQVEGQVGANLDNVHVPVWSLSLECDVIYAGRKLDIILVKNGKRLNFFLIVLFVRKNISVSCKVFAIYFLEVWMSQKGSEVRVKNVLLWFQYNPNEVRTTICWYYLGEGLKSMTFVILTLTPPPFLEGWPNFFLKIYMSFWVGNSTSFCAKFTPKPFIGGQ